MVHSKIKDPLVWIDCEMTGLDLEKDIIIEVFCIITDGDLNIIDAEGYGTVVHQSKERMNQMDEWCTNTHRETGLTSAVIASTTTDEQAAEELLAYIKKYIPHARSGLLAGNSVHADKAFLRIQPWKKVHDYLSYRILDVSTIKEAARRWVPQVYENVPKKKLLHKAKDDILESIAEAKYYKEALFQQPKQISQEKPKTE